MAENLFTIQDCDAVVKKCLKSDQIETVDFAVVRLPDQNYLMKITVNHGTEKKILNFFAKSVRESPKVNQIFYSFKKTVPQFDPKITPKLYYDRSDVLIFEDLTWQGFKTCLVFDLSHLQQALRVLAKFHAGSLAYEEIKSEKLKKKYRLDEEYQVDCFNIKLRGEKVKSVLSSLTEDGNSDELIFKFEELSKKFRKTLCHSNLTSENIMFKYENGLPIDCKLINLKSRHYAPPIYDVLQLIFFNADDKVRQHHLEFFIEDYYSYLKKELKTYGLKPEEILTEDELKLALNLLLPLVKLEKYLRHPDDKIFEDLQQNINCPFLTREDCYIIVKNAVKTSEYDFLSYTVTPLDKASGYLGDYHKLQIKIYRRNEEKIINCFVKRIPKGKSSRSLVEETGCFFKEVFVYQILVPQLLSLGIDIISDCLPACYFQRPEDLMVFDDLSIKNYKMLSVYESYDLHLLSLAIKKLAKFHAATFIFEEEMSKKLRRNYRLNEDYSKLLDEIFFLKKENHRGSKLFQVGVKSIPDVVDLFPEAKTEANQKKLMEAMPKLEEIFFSVVRTSGKYRNVISHGDLWTNNIMVRFDGEKPVDCCFVDFQCLRYCPPAHDFLSILHLTTNRAARLKYGEDLKKIYYNELSEVLLSYCYDVDKILPYEEFEESVQYIKPQMVMQTMMYSSFMCTSEEISSLLTNDEMCNYVFYEDRKDYLKKMSEKSVQWKAKMKDCVLDLYDFCSTFTV